MGDNFIEDEKAVPTFGDIPITVNRISTSDPDDDVVVDMFPTSGSPRIPSEDIPAPKKRGRPLGSKNRVSIGGNLPTLSTGVKGRVASDLSVRGQQILIGTTGLGAIWRPHILMTEEEARAICDPLASYLVRQAEYSEVIAEFIDRWDLFAVVIATLAYLVRVIKEDNEYRDTVKQQRRIEEPRSRTVERVRDDVPIRSENGAAQNEREIHGSVESTPDVEGTSWISTPNLGGL
jgi:hypothetical protein